MRIEIDVTTNEITEHADAPVVYVEPEPVIELTPTEKLASAGLTVDELKSLLGLT